MNVAESIGRNIARHREPTGLSQEDCGLRAGLHRTAVGQIERGERIPRADSLVKIAGALGCSPCDLLAGLSWRPSEIVPGGFDQPDGSS
jgi:transcriptional regulator with XRE-family HTH domain